MTKDNTHVAVDIQEIKQDHLAFEPIPPIRQLTLECSHISAYVSSFAALKKPPLWRRLLGKPSSASMDNTIKILSNISLKARPGEILAFMGPSGSGKTTLLTILAGRSHRSMTITGEIMFNKQQPTKQTKRKVGFVSQDDLLYETLTVYETLFYAAMLRLNRSMTKDEKIERVNSVINGLGLDKCKDTIIGGFFRRGISGGERKRTSIGHELLIDPSVLMLDEPTSGLDSTTAMHVMDVLKSLARGGRAVITTIHQPSSRLYRQLDKLMLLSGGHVMYYGDGDGHVVLEYFECIGFLMPTWMHVADFILDLASGEEIIQSSGEIEHGIGTHCRTDGDTATTNTATGEKLMIHAIHCTEKFLIYKEETMCLDGYDAKDQSMLRKLCSSTESVEGDGEYADGTVGLQLNRKDVCGIAQSDGVHGLVTTSDQKERKEPRWGASYWTQVSILFQRSVRTRRFQSLTTQDISQFTIIAVLAGLFWLQKGKQDTVAAARDVIGILFFMTMFLSFRSMFLNLFTFPEEQRHMLKERSSGMYRLSAFYLARSLSDFPSDMSLPTAFIIIVYFMAGLRYTAAAFWGVYGTLLLAMFVAQSLGLLLGSYFMNPKTAQTVASVLMLAIVLTGGFFVQSIPSWISWLKYLSYIYYTLGLLLFIEYDGGNRMIYSCTSVVVEAGRANQCTPSNPGNPEENASCVPVEE